jgi:hypothetical protein
VHALAQVVALFAAGASPNPTNKGGVTPLIYAASEGWDDTIPALLAGGADPAIATVKGRTAYQAAKEKLPKVAADERPRYERVLKLLENPVPPTKPAPAAAPAPAAGAPAAGAPAAGAAPSAAPFGATPSIPPSIQPAPLSGMGGGGFGGSGLGGGGLGGALGAPATAIPPAFSFGSAPAPAAPAAAAVASSAPAADAPPFAIAPAGGLGGGAQPAGGGLLAPARGMLAPASSATPTPLAFSCTLTPAAADPALAAACGAQPLAFAAGPAFAAPKIPPAISTADGTIAAAAAAPASVSLPLGGSILFRPPAATDAKPTPAAKPVPARTTAPAPAPAPAPAGGPSLRRSTGGVGVPPAAPPAAAPAAAPTPLASSVRAGLAGSGREVLGAASPLLKVVEHIERRAAICDDALARLRKAAPKPAAPAPSTSAASSASASASAGSGDALAGGEARVKAAQAALAATRGRSSGLEGALVATERMTASVLRPAVALLSAPQPDPEVVRALCLMPVLPDELYKLQAAVNELEMGLHQLQLLQVPHEDRTSPSLGPSVCSPALLPVKPHQPWALPCAHQPWALLPR